MGAYKDIRPYDDSEFKHYINILVKDPIFANVAAFVYDGDTEKAEQVLKALGNVKTRHELQTQFMRPTIEEWITKRTTKGVTHSGIEKLDPKKGYLFISNHRDIILDSALMNVLMVNQKFDTTEIAIGDNLLIYDWIHHLVKLNGAFEVKRNLPVRELLTASKHMSAYIRERVSKDNVSIWLAQREGRTKDGFDQTQQGVLKMLNLSNKRDFSTGFQELQIVPLAISYEREPCGISKVEEIYLKENGGFEKTQKDDLMGMVLGLTLPKGSIHFAFGDPIKMDDIIEDPSNKANNFNLLAEEIDRQIYSNYRLYPYNYIAADMLSGKNEHADKIDAESRAKFEELLNDLVTTIGTGDKDRQIELFLKMYATPLYNHEKAIKAK